jgi:hypothetical protein
VYGSCEAIPTPIPVKAKYAAHRTVGVVTPIVVKRPDPTEAITSPAIM